jgi:hypothetical protein
VDPQIEMLAEAAEQAITDALLEIHPEGRFTDPSTTIVGHATS